MEELEGKDIHQANHLNGIDELNHQIIEEDTVGCLAKKNLGLFLTWQILTPSNEPILTIH